MMLSWGPLAPVGGILLMIGWVLRLSVARSMVGSASLALRGVGRRTGQGTDLRNG